MIGELKGNNLNNNSKCNKKIKTQKMSKSLFNTEYVASYEGEIVVAILDVINLLISKRALYKNI